MFDTFLTLFVYSATSVGESVPPTPSPVGTNTVRPRRRKQDAPLSAGQKQLAQEWKAERAAQRVLAAQSFEKRGYRGALKDTKKLTVEVDGKTQHFLVKVDTLFCLVK